MGPTGGRSHTGGALRRRRPRAPSAMPDGKPGRQARRAGRRPGGARGRDDARRLDLGGRGAAPPRARSRSPPSRSSPGPSATGPAPAGDPRRRRARRVAEDRLQGARRSPPTPSSRTTRSEEEIGGCTWGVTIVLSLLLAVGLFFVVPVGATSLIKDQLGSLVPLLAGRGRPADRDLPRLPRRDQPPAATCGACSSTTAPSTRRSPATRPGDELTPGARQALLAPAPALRHQLPADRDGRGDLRLRADRPARLVLAGRSRASSASR